MFSLLHRSTVSSDLLTSKLLDEGTFYDVFLKDLNECRSEVVIESPFITSRRLAVVLPVLEKLKARKVRIVINTRDPREHDDGYMRDEAHNTVASLQRKGIHVLYTAGHHRKIAIIDRQILYEGSLNILSQNDSSEIMRRIESTPLAWQMIKFVGTDKLIS